MLFQALNYSNMEVNKFYKFNSANKRSAINLEAIIKFSSLKLQLQDSPLIINNKCKVDKGKKWFDLIEFSTSFSTVILSQRVFHLLEEINITGWGSIPLEIEGYPDLKYSVIQVLSKAGRILNREDLNNYVTENCEFDISTWDGSDIFHLEDTLLHVCTSRVKEILEKAKVTNIEFRPL